MKTKKLNVIRKKTYFDVFVDDEKKTITAKLGENTIGQSKLNPIDKDNYDEDFGIDLAVKRAIINKLHKEINRLYEEEKRIKNLINKKKETIERLKEKIKNQIIYKYPINPILKN